MPWSRRWLAGPSPDRRPLDTARVRLKPEGTLGGPSWPALLAATVLNKRSADESTILGARSEPVAFPSYLGYVPAMMRLA